MGKAGHNAGFPLFSKPARGKTAKQLRKITKDLVETTKDLGKTIRHLVFPGCYLAILHVAGGVTKKATKPLLNIVYIKSLALKIGRRKHGARVASCFLRPVVRFVSGREPGAAYLSFFPNTEKWM